MPEALEAAPKKKSKLKWIILLFLLLMVGGLGATWFFVLDQKLPFGLGKEGGGASQAGQTNSLVAPAENLITLDPFTVNLADPQGRRVIRLGLALELGNATYAVEVKQQEARVRDAIIMLLASKTVADLSSEGSKATLKQQITDRTNQALGGAKIVQVFITDFRY